MTVQDVISKVYQHPKDCLLSFPWSGSTGKERPWEQGWWLDRRPAFKTVRFFNLSSSQASFAVLLSSQQQYHNTCESGMSVSWDNVWKLWRNQMLNLTKPELRSARAEPLGVNHLRTGLRIGQSTSWKREFCGTAKSCSWPKSPCSGRATSLVMRSSLSSAELEQMERHLQTGWSSQPVLTNGKRSKLFKILRGKNYTYLLSGLAILTSLVTAGEQSPGSDASRYASSTRNKSVWYGLDNESHKNKLRLLKLH